MRSGFKMSECKIRFLLTSFTPTLSNFTCRFNLRWARQLSERARARICKPTNTPCFLRSHERGPTCANRHKVTRIHWCTHALIWLNMLENIACCFRSDIFITPHPLLVFNATLLPQLLSSISGNRACFLLSVCVLLLHVCVCPSAAEMRFMSHTVKISCKQYLFYAVEGPRFFILQQQPWVSFSALAPSVCSLFICIIYLSQNRLWSELVKAARTTDQGPVNLMGNVLLSDSRH